MACVNDSGALDSDDEDDSPPSSKGGSSSDLLRDQQRERKSRGTCSIPFSPLPVALWISDDASPTCMICKLGFHSFKRRHHCRRCGKLVCRSCTYKHNVHRFVCTSCYQTLVDPSSALISQPSAIQTITGMSSTYIDVEDLPVHIAAQFPNGPSSPPRNSSDKFQQQQQKRPASVVNEGTLYQNSFDTTLGSPSSSRPSSSTTPQYGFLSTQKVSRDLYAPDFDFGGAKITLEKIPRKAPVAPSPGNSYSEDLNGSIYQATPPASPAPTVSAHENRTVYTAFHDSQDEINANAADRNPEAENNYVTSPPSASSYATSLPSSSSSSYATSLPTSAPTTTTTTTEKKREDTKNRFLSTKSLSYSKIRNQYPFILDNLLTKSSLNDEWNARFQQCLELPDGGEKYQSLSLLAYQFQVTATNYAKIIVSEMTLPTEKKTIKPLDIGGAAGGEKYLVRGILFKFNYDLNNLYGGDEFAMKAAGHDLRGLVNALHCAVPGLYYPLMLLVNYLGYRLTAVSLLPIDKSTLRYGSDNGGVAVKDESPFLRDKVKLVGEKLRLKPHLTGRIPKTIYGPGDIEGHEGTDNRYYLVDLARMFPPEAPISVFDSKKPAKGSILYNLLRPELLLTNPVPLSSDAFTNWSLADPNRSFHNREVMEATKRLFDRMVPNYAERLDSGDSFSVRSLHAAGINCRHMGRVRRLVSALEPRRQLLSEMILRTLKKYILWLLRTEKTSAEATCCATVAKVFSAINGGAYDRLLVKDFTDFVKALVKAKFKKAFSREEFEADTLLYEMVNPYELILGLAESLGVTLSERALVDFKRSRADFCFIAHDIEQITPTVKHMNILDMSDGLASFFEALSRKSPSAANRLLLRAVDKLKLALESLPCSSTILYHLSNAQVIRAKYNDNNKDLLTDALETVEKLLSYYPSNYGALEQKANIYCLLKRWQDAIEVYKQIILEAKDQKDVRCRWGRALMELKDYAGAVKQFDEVLVLDPKDVQVLLESGTALLQLAQNSPAGESLLSIAGDRFERALTYDKCANITIFDDFLRTSSGLSFLSGLRACLNKPLIFKKFCESCSTISSLDLLETNVTDDQLAVILSKCFAPPAALLSLKLQKCSQLTDAGIGKGIQTLQKLITIDLSDTLASQSTAASLLSFPAALEHLTSLYLARCNRLSENALCNFSKLKGLKNISLKGINSCTDKVLSDLMTNCLDLEKLDIGLCTQITTDGLLNLVKMKRKSMKYLYLKKLTSGVLTEEHIINIFQSFTELLELDVTGSVSEVVMRTVEGHAFKAALNLRRLRLSKEIEHLHFGYYSDSVRFNVSRPFVNMANWRVSGLPVEMSSVVVYDIKSSPVDSSEVRITVQRRSRRKGIITPSNSYSLRKLSFNTTWTIRDLNLNQDIGSIQNETFVGRIRLTLFGVEIPFTHLMMDMYQSHSIEIKQLSMGFAELGISTVGRKKKEKGSDGKGEGEGEGEEYRYDPAEKKFESSGLNWSLTLAIVAGLGVFLTSGK